MANSPSDPAAAPPDSTYELSGVSEKPELTNRSDVARLLERLYPPLLRDAGITGTVQVRFSVGASGRVAPESISVENATHEAFGQAAIRVVGRMRFKPAMVGEQTVPVWVIYPITFDLRK